MRCIEDMTREDMTRQKTQHTRHNTQDTPHKTQDTRQKTLHPRQKTQVADRNETRDEGGENAREVPFWVDFERCKLHESSCFMAESKENQRERDPQTWKNVQRPCSLERMRSIEHESVAFFTKEICFLKLIDNQSVEYIWYPATSRRVRHKKPD